MLLHQMSHQLTLPILVRNVGVLDSDLISTIRGITLN